MHDVHLAIKLRSLGDVHEAMSRDLSLNVNQSLFGATALSLCLYYNCDEALNLLLDRHLRTATVDLDQLSFDPQKRLEPALVTAVRLGNKTAVCRLLECGADIEVVDGFGHTALWTAARERRFSLAVSLLCRGATVRPSLRSASLPVFAASRLSTRRTDLTQLLLIAGADDVNDDKQSLLSRMLAPGRHAVIRLLLSACRVSLQRHVSYVTPGSRMTPITHDDSIDSLLHHYFSQPASLQSQCRWTIRRVVTHAVRGRHFLHALSRLPLPKPLINYLALIDVVSDSELIENKSLNWSQLIHELSVIISAVQNTQYLITSTQHDI